MYLKIMNWLTIFGVFIFCIGCAECAGGSGGKKYGVRSNTSEDDVLNRELLSEKFGKFDYSLLSELTKENQDKNIIISPVSMKLLLALLVEGSSGDTAAEILQTLQLKDRTAGISILRKLQSTLRNDRSSITLKSGNRIYVANGVSVKKDYGTTVKSVYGGEIENLDFSNTELASNTINRKVNEVTHGLIPSVVEKDMIDSSTRLFLLNYIYLKAAWEVAFRTTSTRTRCFFSPPDRCEMVKFMYSKREVNFTDSEEYKSEVFELSFKDPRYRIVFMLPHKNVNVYDVLQTLEGKNLHESFKKLEETTVNLQIPRTVVEFSTNMVGTLTKLGINTVFGANAKLDNMVKNERLAVGSVVHKARIEINEEGAEAAAVSGGNIQFLSLDQDRNILADRPFLFFIRDITVGGFLFEGVVFSPDRA